MEQKKKTTKFSNSTSKALATSKSPDCVEKKQHNPNKNDRSDLPCWSKPEPEGGIPAKAIKTKRSRPSALVSTSLH